MATVQCERNHFYDDTKHSRCPHCPVPGLSDVNIPRTQAAPASRPGVPRTEPAFPGRATAGPTQPAGGNSASSGNTGRSRSGMAGVTVGIYPKEIGREPVVGWIVCVKGDNKGRDYRLHSDLNKIGRDPHMDVCIEGDETISRENHCQIAYSPRSKTFTLVPGTGRNLIYLNEADVFAATRLSPYDRIDLGQSSFLFIPFCSDQFNWDAADLAVKPARPTEPHEESYERPPG